MRTLLVMPLADRKGGAETTLLHLIEAGDPPGLEVTLAFLADGPMVADARAAGVETVVIDAGRLREARKYGAAVRRLASLARERRAELVVSWMSWAHLYAGPAALMARVPSVFHQHGLPRKEDWRDVAATLIPNRGVLVPSKLVADAQARLWPRRRIRVVHPAVDTERFDPQRLAPKAELRTGLRLPPDTPIVGMVARLQRWKGAHRLVEALPRVPGALCVIVGPEDPGDPGYRAELEAQARGLGVSDRFRLVGRQDDAASWMGAMDVVVHASDTEPFGLVVLEGMALGKPVVASNEGGPLEMITAGEDGLLVDPRDPRALAAAIETCLDEGFAAHIGAAARKRALAFSTAGYPSAVAAALLELADRSPSLASRV